MTKDEGMANCERQKPFGGMTMPAVGGLGILATRDPHNRVALAARIHAALAGRSPGRWTLRVNRPP